jgi:two-component system, OmpR family, copper resistance phosphate regulon response regulator CusR
MRILLVEDETDAALMLAKGLREQSYAVDIASDGDSALEKASVNTYDLIILDILLPGIDGLEVCRRLRKSGLTVPVLLLTARIQVNDRITGLDSGADDYLTKPFHFGELLARIRALLRRGPELRDAVLTVGDLTIDTRAHTVRRGAVTIPLTSKEYALIEYLARRKGEVVGRAEISEHVWEETYDPFSNLIEVYIQRLRRKLDTGHTSRLLHTRRGEGYVLSAEPEVHV